MPSENERASIPLLKAESLTERNPVGATASGPMDIKFDQKFISFKHDLEEKEADTQS